MRSWWMVLVMVPALLMAGCTSYVPDCDRPLFSAHTVPPDAALASGFGEAVHVLRVVDQDGAPIADAAVHAYMGLNATGGGTQTTWFLWISETREVKESALVVRDVLRTGDDGTATFIAPHGALVTFVATAPGMTEEWDHGRPGETLDVRLYPATARASYNGSWEDVDVSYAYLGLGDDVRWAPVPMPWHDDAGVSAQMNRRVTDLTAHATWTTSPGADGDFGLGLGVAGDRIDVYHNSEDELLDWGEHEETIALDFDALLGLAAVADDAVYIGLTEEAAASPAGTPFTVELEATLDPTFLRNEYCTAEYQATKIMSVEEALAASEAHGGPSPEPGTVTMTDPDGPDAPNSPSPAGHALDDTVDEAPARLSGAGGTPTQESPASSVIVLLAGLLIAAFGCRYRASQR